MHNNDNGILDIFILIIICTFKNIINKFHYNNFNIIFILNKK